MPEFTQIGSTSDCFFWCLREYNGKLYAGTYGYPKAYNYPPWTLLKNFAAGESLTDLKILGGKLYASTENKGYIYRMNPANPTDWAVVHDDAWVWGLALGVMGDYIYCAYADSPWTGEAKVMRSSDGDSWSEVYKSYKGGWFFILYDGYLYNIGGGEDGLSSALRSSNGTTWNEDTNLAGFSGAFNPALVKNGYLFMALGERTDGKTKIYRYNGSTAPSEVLSVTAFRGYGFNNVAILDNEMYFLFGPDMNSGSPGSVTYYLYKSATGASGEWTLVKTFTANRKLSHGKYRTQGCVTTFDNHLYIGIQDKIYKMEEEAPPLPPPLPPPPLEEDHLGANWIISADAKIAGKHTNIGLFKVNPGVTAIVQPYDGALYGTLEVHATNIVIDGVITASGKGFGGGGAGGGGGGSGFYTYHTCYGGGGGAGVARGSNGSAGSRGANTENYKGADGGNGGAGGGDYGGGGGAKGVGTSPGGNGTAGSAGKKGGYATSEGQGDISIDESLKRGSGGGGAGGGGGGGAVKVWWPAPSKYVSAAGGGGGGGGAANRGGGWIKLYATISISILGNIYAKGLDNSAGNGGGGAPGPGTCNGGGGGVANLSGTSNGGAGGAREVYGAAYAGSGGVGGEGGFGAGGGVLLKCAIDSAISITGTIDNRGGGNSPDNGGTVKIFYAVTAPSTARIYAGRLYTKSIPAIPTYTEGTITHACGAKISYQASSITAQNVALTCPYDNLSLGVSGIKETVIITNIDAMAAKLQGEIATLDNRIAELLGQIEALSDEMANIKAILGV